MPIAHEIDHAGRTMKARARGTVTYGEIVAHLAEERLDGGLAYRELIDARGGELDITPDEVRRLVAALRNLGQDGALGPTAVVVDSEFTFGMLRMLETLVEDVCAIRPFRDHAEAERWLAEQPEALARGADRATTDTSAGP